MLEKNDVIGDYRLEKFLGRGQYGEVWLAEKQLQFSTRKVRHALKFLSGVDDEVNIKDAQAEVDTWIEASGHPNVMSVLDMFLYKNRIVIVSEFAEGGSLNTWLQKYGGKTPSEKDALEMLSGILRGIEHLHSKSVVHRDLKPDNILLQGNFPRIADFGISRIVSDGTMATKAIGSPAYMSPESFDGIKSLQGDIWSAGVILYEMLTGKYPFSSETIYGLALAIQQEEMKPLPATISPQIGKIIETALQKDNAKRYKSAKEMNVAVERELRRIGVDSDAIDSATIQDLKTVPIDFSSDKTVKIDETAKIPKPDFEKFGAQSSETLLKEKKIADTIASDVAKTDDTKLPETKNWQVLEKERIEREQSELTKIGSEIKQRKTAETQSNLVRNVMAAIGGILGLLIVGAIIWKFSGDKPIAISNTNSASETNQNSSNSTAKIPEGMVYVSGGEFTVGRDDGKSEAEKPARKISVKPFYIDIYETTNEQYAEFVKATNRKPPSDWTDGNFPKGQEKFPVVGVNWDDANAFANWAKKRLPTEEEWEFAARGANGLFYTWGNDWKKGNANADGESRDFAEVGKFKSDSPFGTFDMIGNAWEWTSSDFKPYPNGKLPDAFAGKNNLKTIRGGSFEATKDFATTTYRIGWAATGADNYSRTGFRCAKDLETK